MKTKVCMIVLALFFVLLGCEEEECVPGSFYDEKPLWIDSHCSDADVAAIEDAVQEMNYFSEDNICQPLVKLEGVVEADHYLLDPDVGGVNVILCYNEEPRWYYNVFEGDIGAASAKEIRLFLFLREMSYDKVKSLVMHELMHFVAARPGVKGIGHLDPETQDGVMLPRGKYVTEYSDDDRDLFCESFDCV